MKRKKEKKKWNKLPPIEFKDFVEKTVEEVKQFCGLTDYRIIYNFSAVKPANGDHVIAAEIHVDHKYLQSRITVYSYMVDLYKNGDKGRVQEILCHELAHIRVGKLERLASDRYATSTEINEANESLTEIMGRLMYANVGCKINHQNVNLPKQRTGRTRNIKK